MKVVVIADITGDQVSVIVPEPDLWDLKLMAARTGLAIIKVEDEEDVLERVLGQPS